MDQLSHWYHQVLNCIESCNPAASAVHQQYYPEYCAAPERIAPQAQMQVMERQQQISAGRDRLLERNSCRQPDANQLLHSVQASEQATCPQAVLEQAAELLNLHYEPLDAQRYSLIPSDSMLIPSLPGIADEGQEITFDRACACAREETQFITWDHPLMQGLYDLVSTSALGSASVALFPTQVLPAGTLFIEALFTLDIQAANALSVRRFFPNALLRIVVTENNDQDLGAKLSLQSLAQVLTPATHTIARALIQDYRCAIETLVQKAEHLAQAQAQTLIQQAQQAIEQQAKQEQARLQHLQQRNPMITKQEIQTSAEIYQALQHSLSEHCRVNLHALRALVTCPQ